MYQWDENPLLPMLVFACAGILFTNYFPVAPVLIWAGIPLIAGAILLCFRHVALAMSKWIGRIRTLWGWLLYFWIGAAAAGYQNSTEHPVGLHRFSCTVIESYGLQADGKLRCLAHVDFGNNDTVWKQTDERVLLQFSGQQSDLKNGDRLLVSRELTNIEKPGIPGQFDAAAFYGRQGIYYQVFLKPGQFAHILPSRPTLLRSVSQQCRSFLEQALMKHVPEKNDGYMLSALLLGIRRKIDPELKAAYSAAGVTHILAVSGMHVGLIFGCLVFVFGWIRNWKTGAWAFSLVIIGLLWFYALVTGLSPSVLRAVTVFSVMQLNDLFKKPPLAINGLCFATLILLFADTDLVFDVGYQLSFAAVYGIVSFQRPILDFWRPKSWVLKSVWEGIAVTLAATIATFPVILYYFHQFPVYFLLANLVAVPVSNALIYAGIVLLLVSPFSALAKIVGWVIHWTLAFLNGFVVFIEQLPYSSIADIYMPWYTLFLLFLFLIALHFWFHYAGYRFLRNALLLLFVSCLTLAIDNFRMWNERNSTFVMRTSKEWMLGNLDGRNASLSLLSGSEAKKDRSFEVKALKEGMHMLNVVTRLDTGEVISSDKKTNQRKTRLVVWQGKSYLFLSNYLNRRQPPKKIRIEALVVLQAGYKTIGNALEVFEPNEIWVDWKPSQEMQWKKDHKSSRIRLINHRTCRFRYL